LLEVFSLLAAIMGKKGRKTKTGETSGDHEALL